MLDTAIGAVNVKVNIGYASDGAQSSQSSLGVKELQSPPCRVKSSLSVSIDTNLNGR